MTKKVMVKQKQKTRVDVLKYSIKKNREIYIMLIPIILYYIVFKYVPMFGNVIAFQDYKVTRGIFESNFVCITIF